MAMDSEEIDQIANNAISNYTKWNSAITGSGDIKSTMASKVEADPKKGEDFLKSKSLLLEIFKIKASIKEKKLGIGQLMALSGNIHDLIGKIIGKNNHSKEKMESIRDKFENNLREVFNFPISFDGKNSDQKSTARDSRDKKWSQTYGEKNSNFNQPKVDYLSDASPRDRKIIFSELLESTENRTDMDDIDKQSSLLW
jgi:hypothetical protein